MNIQAGSSTAPWRRSGGYPCLVAVCLLVIVVGLGPVSVAAEPAAEESDGLPEIWTQTYNEYMTNPRETAPQLLALARDAGPGLPLPVKVVLADAHLRLGQIGAAREILVEVLAAEPGYPWADFANLGLGAVEMTRGDGASAVPYFEAVAGAGELSSQALGNLGLGHALVASGRPEVAKAAFDAVAANQAVDNEVRQAGQFGSGLSRYAAGDHEGAAEAFEALAEADPTGPFSDDARYAAARARLESGDREGSVASLQELVAECDAEERSGRAPRSLRRLDPRAVGREWLRNYRRNSWFSLHGPGTRLYAIGGCRLGRSTLRELGVDENAPRVVQVGADARSAEDVRPVADTAAIRPRLGADAETRRAEGRRWTPWIAGAAAIALLVALWRWRAGRSGGS